jgi:hypothetical protein
VSPMTGHASRRREGAALSHPRRSRPTPRSFDDTSVRRDPSLSPGRGRRHRQRAAGDDRKRSAGRNRGHGGRRTDRPSRGRDQFGSVRSSSPPRVGWSRPVRTASLRRSASDEPPACLERVDESVAGAFRHDGRVSTVRKPDTAIRNYPFGSCEYHQSYAWVGG